jgi:pyrimidine deaminase RibD-like protein
MDDQQKRKVTDYVTKAYAAALHTSTQLAEEKIAQTKAWHASKGIISSGSTVHAIAKIQGEHINTVVQARADALLDAYELYGVEIGGEILGEVTALRSTLIGQIGFGKTGLPPGLSSPDQFMTLLDTNTGAILNLISCQIEQRKVFPKFPKPDSHRVFEVLAIQEAQHSVAEDERPHPRVGAVVVKDGKVVSQAHRGEIPKGHAEFIALEGKLADDLVAGSTVYTTLEPCTTRTHPKIPCAERLIERRVARVFVGMLDPNPDIQGFGIRALNKAGIETQFFPRDLQSQIEDLNREFIRAQRERPPRASAVPSTPSAAPEENPKRAEILKHKGKTVTVFNRQKYGHGYLEGFWANGAIVIDCTPLWVVLEDAVAKNQQSFTLDKVEVSFDFERKCLQLTLYR